MSEATIVNDNRLVLFLHCLFSVVDGAASQHVFVHSVELMALAVNTENFSFFLIIAIEE